MNTMSMTTRAEPRQQQKLSPRLQQAVRLRQLSSLDFKQELQTALGRNPFLEGEEDDDDESARSDDVPDESTVSGELDTEFPQGEAANDDERDSWLMDGMPRAPRGEGGDGDLMNIIPSDTTLTAHLHSQLNLLALPARDVLLAKAIVESLDDDGYLRIDLKELLGICKLTPRATPQELLIALRRVQSLDPAGVGARDVSECLLLQLPAIACPEERKLASTIVREHLRGLASRDVSSIARQLGASPELVDAACARIRRMDPRPGWRFGSARIQYITPDVVVKKVRGTWTASLNPAIVPRVRLNQVYAQMFQRHRCAGNSALAGQLQEARWTLRNVEQRFSTILDVAQAIVKRQGRFFDHGPMAIKPLGLREIAEELGLHESTVSRVTNNKFMATPSGTVELKYFFSRAMTAVGGGVFSGTAIRGLVKDMIEAETSQDPLSDAEIARQLAQQGLVVARRTVTKYRHLMRVESVERRRKAA